MKVHAHVGRRLCFELRLITPQENTHLSCKTASKHGGLNRHTLKQTHPSHASAYAQQASQTHKRQYTPLPTVLIERERTMGCSFHIVPTAVDMVSLGFRRLASRLMRRPSLPPTCAPSPSPPFTSAEDVRSIISYTIEEMKQIGIEMKEVCGTVSSKGCDSVCAYVCTCVSIRC